MIGLKPKPEPQAQGVQAPARDLVNTRMVIFGNSGSGKSALGWAFFSAGVLAGARKHYVVVEPEAYFYEGFGICTGLEEAGFNWIELNEEVLAQNPDVTLSSQEWAKGIRDNPKIVVTARAMRPKVREYFGGVLAEALLLVGDTLTLWDELPAFLPHSERGHGGILQMMNAGRKEGVDMILISQFRTQSHPMLTKVASESYASHNYVFAYQVQDENELRALRPVFGDRTPELRELPRLHFLVRLPNGAVERSSNPEVFEALFGYAPEPEPDKGSISVSGSGAPENLFEPEPEPENLGSITGTTGPTGPSSPEEPRRAQEPQAPTGPDGPKTPKPKPEPVPEEPLELKRDPEGRLYVDGPNGALYIHRNRAGLFYPKKSPEGALTELPQGARVVKRRGRVCILLP